MADIFYNKTITVFNHAASDDVLGRDIWYPTVLKNVRLLINKGANVSKSGTENADAASLYIRPELLQDGAKSYLPPKEWGRLPEKCKNYFYTFASGEDFFVEGDRENEQQEDDFFSYMREKYDNCFKVTNVDSYELIPHLEVGGA